MRKPQNILRQIRRKNRKVEQGQALLEFALIVPALFLMLLGVAVMAQGFNLQMVLYGAAYEGARIWAKNPAGADTIHCTPPACNPNSGNATNFETYVVPAVRQYMANNGFKEFEDGKKKLFFYSKDGRTAQNTLNLISNNPQLVNVTLLYSYSLPFGSFGEGISFTEVVVSASCTLKRGS